jgi:succinate dehydrogenase / fumarate reductase cytochrome b subunit
MSTTQTLGGRLATTVGKELVVGITGVLLVVFILGHLAGNLLLLLGPEAFNDYAEKLHSLGELIWVARFGLIVAFVAHISCAISLARASAKARGAHRYEVEKSVGRKTPATRMMIISGLTILFFVLYHIYDFTISGQALIARSQDTVEPLTLYDVVYESFANPLRSAFYIIAVLGVGLHLSHAVASVVSTLGVLTERATDQAELAAKGIGAVVAFGFSIIPLYVLFHAHILN